MNHFISNLALRWGQCVTRYPWLLLIVSVLICIALAIGAKGLTFSNDYRAFFSPENPELVAFENFQDKYSKNDNILIVVHDEQSQGLTPNHAKVVEQLTEQAWKTPFASRVDSITNFQHTYAEQDDLIVADLIKNAEQLSWPALQEKARIALDEPLLANRLIANNGRTSGINITVQYPGSLWRKCQKR